VNNLLRIMSLDEEDVHRVSFVNPREEAGINAVYDPEVSGFVYQVFIHNRFPYLSRETREFSTFAEARSHAAKAFSTDWEMLAWDQKTKRPCEEGGYECGSGSCATCSTMKSEGGEGSTGCGGCGHA